MTLKQFYTVEFKLYLNKRQEATLEQWLHASCWVYNQLLEHRIKSYKRRKESKSLYDQTQLVTKWRSRIKRLKDCPVEFLRDAARRVSRGMEDFFRRIKIGKKPGYPRFKPHQRYNTLESLDTYSYIRGGKIG